jgi:hypothetical protein
MRKGFFKYFLSEYFIKKFQQSKEKTYPLNKSKIRKSLSKSTYDFTALINTRKPFKVMNIPRKFVF